MKSRYFLTTEYYVLFENIEYLVLTTKPQEFNIRNISPNITTFLESQRLLYLSINIQLILTDRNIFIFWIIREIGKYMDYNTCNRYGWNFLKDNINTFQLCDIMLKQNIIILSRT
ncbi:hypothetical protein HHI36_008080 [Cryptolaemus montrouzieri]|uniref:Uncharacterized protein n=1 Tax=Cryptolaemus montrouzieri TaxID=559131 RepID=A0ABD2MRH7_9CUCU